jgi:lysyl-tRNA synthetase class 2
MFAEAREFFHERGIMEVDCPLITNAASVDLHIDLIPTEHSDKRRYLHSSPEYGMKRLLAHGIGDIYQLAHVFRQGDHGQKHNPEFMMAEWYRLGLPFEEMIEETLDFIRLFLGPLPSEVLSYREALLKYAEIDYVKLSDTELLNYITDKQLPVYEGIASEGRDALLNVILGLVVEPQLGLDELTVLAYYPSSQAALAQIRQHDDEEMVAERFEIYYQGIELCNGYHELVDGVEQRSRFEETNRQRQAHGKEMLPIDEHFLAALELGIPDCCGVAVGVDRLMMLRHKREDIADIMTFSWEDA